jgi:hypothetical protein
MSELVGHILLPFIMGHTIVKLQMDEQKDITMRQIDTVTQQFLLQKGS